MNGLTGTILQNHLLGDLVDDDWTTTGENGEWVRQQG